MTTTTTFGGAISILGAFAADIALKSLHDLVRVDRLGWDADAIVLPSNRPSSPRKYLAAAKTKLLSAKRCCSIMCPLSRQAWSLRRVGKRDTFYCGCGYESKIAPSRGKSKKPPARALDLFDLMSALGWLIELPSFAPRADHLFHILESAILSDHSSNDVKKVSP